MSATYLALAGYLVTLALVQTAYGKSLMNFRWFALGALTFVALLEWVNHHRREAGRDGARSLDLLLAYLLLTALSLVTAVNPSFSGSRWVSHVLMLLTFVVFLPQSVSLKTIPRILFSLKTILATLLVVSVVSPTATSYEGEGYFRGVTGNSNALGQMAATAALLYLHGMITDRQTWLRRAQLLLLPVAAWTVWSSRSRSASIQLMTGLWILSWLYRKAISRKAVAIATLGVGLALLFPTLPQQLGGFFAKQRGTSVGMEGALSSRIPVWQGYWEGFLEKPWLGWGFGADGDTPRQWEFQWTALGIANRDGINDYMRMLEGCGIVGAVAFTLLIWIVYRERPFPWQRAPS